MDVKGASLEEIEALYRSRFRAFVKVAAAITDGADAGSEAVQEAFATAIRKRKRFRREAPLEAWVWRIVLNKARDRARSRSVPLIPLAAYPVSPNGYEHDAAIRGLLARLPDRQREAIFLRYYGDLDYASIARLLSIKEGTVAATLNAAHAALRREIEEVRE